jgi:hypothetical protein
MPTDNSWMNDQLRALTGTTVNLEDAGEEILKGTEVDGYSTLV